MSDPQKPAAKPAAPNVERIPVRVLRFGHANPTEIPGASGQTSITAQSDKKNQSRYEIEFIPAWRHHRVVFHAVDRDTPTVTMVHESKVSSWEPVV